MVKNTFLGVPILISGGIAAGAVNHLASIRYPRFAAAELSKDTGIFVGLAYLFHMALAPLVHSLIPFGRALQQGHASAEEKAFEVRKRILSYAIQYFNPVVLTLYAAHKLGLKLDHAKALLYTAGIFTSIRLLGELLNWSLKWGFAEESGGHASVISNSEHRD
jgi:hypothetical protein